MDAWSEPVQLFLDLNFVSNFIISNKKLRTYFNACNQVKSTIQKVVTNLQNHTEAMLMKGAVLQDYKIVSSVSQVTNITLSLF